MASGMTSIDPPDASVTESGILGPADPKFVGGEPVAPAKRGLARIALAGTGWLLAQNVGSRIIGLLSQIVLARILVPSEFASIGLASTITAVVGALTAFGVDDVLLQRQNRLDYWSKAAFLISIALGVLSLLLILAATPIAATLYHAPILLSILPIMALGMPISALAIVPGVKLRAALNFRFLATYATIEVALTQLLTILLALRGFGVFCMVLPIPVMALLRTVTFWAVARPTFGRMRSRQLWMLGASGAAVFGTKVITALVGQGDNFTLGIMAPKVAVGNYFFAFRLAVQPIQMLAGNFSNVLFPTFLQLRSETVRQQKAALDASRVLAFIVMPYCFMQAALAPSIMNVFFGSKWEGAIVLVQILSVGLAFDAVSWVAGALLSARGQFRRAFVYSCIFSPPFFLLVAVGAAVASAIGVALAVSAFYIILAPAYSYIVFRSTGASLRDIVSIYVPSTALAGLAMFVATLPSLSMTNPFEQVATIVVLGTGLYVALVRVFVPSMYEEVRNRAIVLARAKLSAA